MRSSSRKVYCQQRKALGARSGPFCRGTEWPPALAQPLGGAAQKPPWVATGEAENTKQAAGGMWPEGHDLLASSLKG